MGDPSGESQHHLQTAAHGYSSTAGVWIVLIYAVFASVWILLSDSAVEWLISDTTLRTSASMVKGWLFVAVTSFLLYSLIQRLLGKIHSTSHSERHAQFEKSRNQQLFRAIVDSSPDAIFAKDLEGRYILSNKEWLRIVGKSAEQSLGHTDADEFPQQAEVIAANDRQVIATNRITSFEETASTVDGERTFLSIKGPLHDDNGEMIGAFGISRDITEKKRAEEHLAKLSLAIEQSSESIIITNTRIEIEYVNEALIRATGYRREELLGQNPRILNSNQTPREVFTAMWDLLNHGHTWRGEYCARRKDGSEFYEWAIISPLRKPDGTISHYVAVKEDITEKKRLGEELDRHRHHLESLVEQRTAELILARQQAEAANQTKSAFLANMSHEIRTPMNAIVGLTHILQRSIDVPEHLGKLGKIAGAADHLLGVINDILDLSKIEANKLVLETSDFDLSELLLRVSSMVIDRSRAKKLELIVDTDHGLGTVNGDSTRLSQALLNYLINAVKFTEHGTIVLRARVLEEGAEKILVRFEVEDTGIGIADEHLPRLFRSFEQADSSTTRRFGGTGLGLVITRNLAALMGGEVGVTSRQNAGSTFWMTARMGKGSSRNGKYRIAELHGKRALAVDDKAITRLVLTQLLRETGMVSDSASSGSAAVDAVVAADRNGSPYDLLLIDLLMPDLNGFETLDKIRHTNLLVQPPALLVTASFDPATSDDAINAGFVDVLFKPLSLSLVHASLRKHQGSIFGPTESLVAAETLSARDELRRDHPAARLLLVEDDPLNQEVALILLGEIGWTIDVADNGEMAIEKATTNDYQLILMDMHMPVMDGIEATRKIRLLPKGRDIPIVAMTANAFTEDKRLCLEAGMNDFLTKPVVPEVLYAKILQYLKHPLNEKVN